jgi:hypothetical protein
MVIIFLRAILGTFIWMSSNGNVCVGIRGTEEARQMRYGSQIDRTCSQMGRRTKVTKDSSPDPGLSYWVDGMSMS